MENRWRMDIWMMQLLHNRWIPIVAEEKAELIEIRNQNTSMTLFLPFNTMLYLYQSQINRFWKIYFESFQANQIWKKMKGKRGKIVFVISRNKRKLRHWFIIQNYWDWFWKIDMLLYFLSTTRLLAPIFNEWRIQFGIWVKFSAEFKTDFYWHAMRHNNKN